MNVIDKQMHHFLPWEDSAYVANPYPWYATARTDHPIYRDTDGCFVLTRYEDVVKYGKIPSLSIREPAGAQTGPWSAMSETVLNMDPPYHTQVRRRFNKWFTPKLVRGYVTATEADVRKQIAALADGEVFDANLLFGVGPTHKAMCKVLGFPEDAYEPVIFAMHKTMAALSETAGDAEQAAAYEAFSYLADRVESMVAARRADPGSDLADAYIDLFEKGEITREELHQTMSLFWASGGHNPSYVISTGIELFARDPELFRTYKAQPEKRNGIINEIFRLYPPELSFARYTTEPVEVRGQTIAVGERIKFIIDSANRDPEYFPDPDRLDMDRPPEAAMNVSFGMGPHQCAGQVISRAEVETVFNTLAELVDSFHIEGEIEMDNSGRSRAYVAFPVSLRKAG